jgi:FKBP-type peptidyl-prolyl cis-trans isomerase FkpA
MKNKNSPPPRPARPLWLVIALLISVAANVVQFAWSARAAKPKPETPPPATASAPDAGPWPRELAPYAALGSFVAENNRIADLKWRPEQFAAFQEGLRASYEGRGLPLDEPAAKLRDEISARVQAMLETERPDPVKDYFRFLREKEGVKETASGLHHRITEEGTGEPPGAGAVVIISYAAGLPDGKSLPALSGTRVKVAVRDLLPGLAEGVQLLRVGGKGLIYVPPALSFKEADWPVQLPREAPLVFFVELHDIQGGP